MQKYVEDRHMAFVPNINLGVVMLADPRTAEGIWARDVPCTVLPNLQLAPDIGAVLDLLNPSFELEGEGGKLSDSDARLFHASHNHSAVDATTAAKAWASGRKSPLATKNLLEDTDGLRRAP